MITPSQPRAPSPTELSAHSTPGPLLGTYVAKQQGSLPGDRKTEQTDNEGIFEPVGKRGGCGEEEAGGGALGLDAGQGARGPIFQ